MRLSRSIFAKFLAAQLPVFLLLLAVGLHYLSEARIHAGQEQMGARLGVQAGRVAGLLADLDLQGEPEVANKLISLLMSDRAVACVEILENGARMTEVSAPRRIGCKGAGATQFTDVPIGLDGGRELRLGVSTAEIDQIRNEARDFGWLIVSVSLVLACIAGSFAFQAVVAQPLNRLLATIHKIAQTGEFTPLLNRSQDELGVVMSSFNDMQEALRQERLWVLEVHDRIDHLYNATPTLLFTMDGQGRLTSVSDYALEAVGFGRAALIGQPVSLLLAPRARGAFQTLVLERLRQRQAVRDAPLEIICRDGRSIEVLLSASMDSHGNAEPDFVCVMTDVTHLRVVERQLRELALTDYLTKLPNRVGMAERMRLLTAASAETRGLAAVMLIDLDNFKFVNDAYGHEAGDALLVEVSRRIRQSLRAGDMAARLGGDEFAIVCSGLQSRREAKEIARRVIDALSQAVELGDKIGFVGASIGIAFAETSFDPDSLIKQADEAMYEAKFNGKNCFAVFGRPFHRAKASGGSHEAEDSRAA